MSTDTKKPASPAPPAGLARPPGRPQPGRTGDADEAAGAPGPPGGQPVAAPPVELPPFDERRLTYAELARLAHLLDTKELTEMVRDGRAMVRANAAIGLAVAGQATADLVALLRDSDVHVARAGAEAIARLGERARSLIPSITVALDGTQPEITDQLIGVLSELIGRADEELTLALDVPLSLAMKTIVEACARVDRGGVAFLIKAAGDHRSRVRINAIGGLARVGRADTD
ncbi:MAG TPA: hypothetical protein VEL05_10750, partial [Candidatus Acidoferrum sp.]|nr:hypothetical protein [Candidatus Acidoferrum sp.]